MRAIITFTGIALFAVPALAGAQVEARGEASASSRVEVQPASQPPDGQVTFQSTGAAALYESVDTRFTARPSDASPGGGGVSSAASALVELQRGSVEGVSTMARFVAVANDRTVMPARAQSQLAPDEDVAGGIGAAAGAESAGARPDAPGALRAAAGLSGTVGGLDTSTGVGTAAGLGVGLGTAMGAGAGLGTAVGAGLAGSVGFGVIR